MESKVTLALGGIVVVLGAVLASMGLLALLGLPSSLIIIEVVPFLVLAVGADNIFIFVQELQVGGAGGTEGDSGVLGDISGLGSPWGRVGICERGGLWGQGHYGAWGHLWGQLGDTLGTGFSMEHRDLGTAWGHLWGQRSLCGTGARGHLGDVPMVGGTPEGNGDP